MANLKATAVTGGLVSEKIGTTPTTTPELNTDLFDGSTERLHTSFAAWTPEAPRICQFDPHNSNRFVVTYTNSSFNGSCRIGLVSGTQITYSNEYVYNPATTRGPVLAFDPSVANKFVVSYRDEAGSNYHRACVGTISAQSSDPTNFQITFGSEATVGSYASVTHYQGDIAFDPNVPGRFSIISHTSSGGSTFGVVICGQVASSGTGTTFSWGAQYTYAQLGGVGYDQRIAYDPNTANRLLVVWRMVGGGGVDNYGYARALEVNNTTLAFSRPYQYDQYFYQGDMRWPSIAWDPNTANKFVISFVKDDDGDKGALIVGTINSGGGLSWSSSSTPSIFNNAATKYTSVVFSTSRASTVIIAYMDDADSDKGKAIVATIDYSGPTISSYSNESTFNNSQTAYPWITIDKQLEGKFIVAFQEGAYPNTAGKVITGQMGGEILSINLSTGSFFTLDMENVDNLIGTFTITGTATGVTIFDLRVIQGSTAKQFDWGAITNVKWPSIPAAISATDNAVDVYSFTTYDNGTTWYGSIVGQDIK